MFENMAGVVGMAIHEDRLAQSAKNMRLAEAKQGRRAAGGGYRETLASMLLTLAAWIAPQIALLEGHTLATGR
ncbi:MAG TPA: hypothetical protein VIG44_03835 [Thermomicrobiales bacterium]|jgi:hypothetical protein